MSDQVLHELSQISDFRCMGAATDDEIRAAEAALGLVFAGDYRACLAAFGAVSTSVLSLTGAVGGGKLDVVDATRKVREEVELDPGKYVVAYEDAFVILQDATGSVFYLQDDGKAKKIFDSLGEYILWFVEIDA